MEKKREKVKDYKNKSRGKERQQKKSRERKKKRGTERECVTSDDEAPGPYITIPQYRFNKTKQHTHPSSYYRKREREEKDHQCTLKIYGQKGRERAQDKRSVHAQVRVRTT